MRKMISLATLSFALTACSGGPDAGPTTLLKEEPGTAAISAGTLLKAGGKTILSYQLGPFNLKAGEENSRKEILRFNVEDPFWLSSFEAKIEDSEGKPLPKELIHQILLTNEGEENKLCTTKKTGNPFAAATATHTKIDLPEGHGYPLLPTQSLEAAVLLANPTETDYFGVHVKLVLKGHPEEEAALLDEVRPMMIDADPCEHTPLELAPGEFAEKTSSAYAPESGYIVKAYGLLQKYGVAVAMTAGDTKDPFWQGKASVAEDHSVVDLKPFEDPAGLFVGRGEKIDLTVTYNNMSADWYNGATAAAIVYLAKDKSAQEAKPAPSSSPQETPPSVIPAKAGIYQLLR